MRLLALATACIALAAMSSGARASEQFDAFQQMCMAGRANYAQALAAADKAGWMPVPQPMMDSLSKSNPIIENPQGRMRSSNARLMIMFVGQGKIPRVENLRGDVCAVAAIPPETALDQELADFAAVPKNDQMAPGEMAYLWRDENGAHVPVTGEKSDIQTQLESGMANLVVEQVMEKMSIVMLLAVSK